MPTTKTRINLSVERELRKTLQKLASRDQTSIAAKTLQLIRIALELEEDVNLLQMVRQRQKKAGTFISHDAIWR